MRLCSCIFVLLAALLVCSATNRLHAQATAEITGTITDNSGAVVPGARVSITNEATGISSEVTSNAAGHYTVPFLRPGRYRIEVQQEGFRTVSRAGVLLQVAQALKVDFELQVGAVTETIEVTDTAPLLDAETNVLGGVVTTDSLMNIPLKGRNTNAFMHLVPGVKVQRGSLNQPVLESHWQFFSVNGNRPNQNLFMLDGSNNNDVGFNGPQYTAQVDLVQEFRVQTSNFSAQYANSAGGVINTVTKSGSNELHGSLFEYFRNDALQGNNFFANLNGHAKPPLRHNQFGGTLGGPVIKNKTFFFGSFEGLRLRLPAGGAPTAAGLVNIISVPDDTQKAGDFSQTYTSSGQLIRIHDPFSTRENPANPGEYIRTPFENNRIPSTMINPIATRVVGYYPNANSPGDPNTRLNNLFFSGSQRQTNNDFSIRIDHQLTESTSLMGRYSESIVNIAAPPVFGEGNIGDPYNSNTDQHHSNMVLTLTKVFSPSTVGEFLGSFNRFTHFRRQESTGNFDPTELGLPTYLAANSKVIGFPEFSVDGFSRVGGYVYETHAYDRPFTSATITRVSGKHTLKFGGSYHFGRLNGITFTHATGAYAFGRSFTQGDPFASSASSGLGLATFLLGTPTSGQHLPRGTDTAAGNKNIGLFIQEDYKVTPKLTLNLGLRWDLESPRTERYNRLANWDFDGTATLSNGTPIRGGLMFPGVNGLDRGQWDAQYDNFSPRFGFAYSVNDATVVRGGFGVFYGNSWGGAANYNQLANPGFTCSTPVATSFDGGLTPGASISDPFPTGFCTPNGSSLGLLSSLGESVPAVDRHHKVSKSVQWTFDIQRQLPENFVLELTYSGNRGLNLVGRNQLNQLHPQYLSLGSQLNSPVPNPFFGVIKQGALSGPTITLGQSLRPYPQFLQAESPIVTYGASTYHALYAKLERRFSAGFSILTSYTFSKIIDDTIASVAGFAGGGTAPGNVQNFYDLRSERSVASYNTPHSLVISYVWELPFGPGKPFLNQGGAAGKIVGGWQINGLTTFQSGDHLQITGGNSSGSFEGLQRPNWSGRDATLSGDIAARRNAYFDTSAFFANDPFTFGNAPRIMPNLLGPGTIDFSISLFKNTRINERFNLQFRVEAFNAFNRVQFGNPNSDFNSNTFGVINRQVNLPRDFQFALKLLF